MSRAESRPTQFQHLLLMPPTPRLARHCGVGKRGKGMQCRAGRRDGRECQVWIMKIASQDNDGFTSVWTLWAFSFTYLFGINSSMVCFLHVQG